MSHALRKLLTVLALIGCACGVIAKAQEEIESPLARAERRAALEEQQNRRTLANAGVPVDEASLLAAMQHEDSTVARAAMRMVPRVQKTQSLVLGLRSVVDHGSSPRRHTMDAIVAIDVLVKLEERGWEPSALTRMHTETDDRMRWHFASLLARGKRGDGWPIVRDLLLGEEVHARSAIQSIDVFHG